MASGKIVANQLVIESGSNFCWKMSAQTIRPLKTESNDNFYRSRDGLAAACLDLLEGTSSGWIWSAMAIQDIKLRYRGSVLGPFWLSLSTVVMVAAMGVIYARLFRIEPSHYLLFLTIGLLLWQFISSSITDGCQTFLSAQEIIHQVPLPFSVYPFRTVYRNLIVLLHCMVILPIVLVLFPPALDWRLVIALPALALLGLNAFWIALLLGLVSARYRDIPPIVASVLQILFFVTPILWPPELLGNWQELLSFNPLFAAIDVVRAPLLGIAPLPHSWTTLALVTLLGCLGTLVAFAKFRPKIAYWV
jgi:ABC-type polysaccharide/polyol phosphate export permease